MNSVIQTGLRAGAALLSVLLLAGCATKFDPAKAGGIHTIAIQAPPNPDGFRPPYDLGLSEGRTFKANDNAAVTAADIFKVTGEKVGDKLAASIAAALTKAGYQTMVVPEGGNPPADADANLYIEIGPLGYWCRGLFLEGECTPVLLTTIALKGKGKTLYDRQCSYGIFARGCADEADPALTLPRLQDVLADPARANTWLRVGVETIAAGVARDLAR